jgi:hypothetical protein
MKDASKKRNLYNQDILDHIQQRYGFSLDYIRKSLRGDRIGILPEKILKEYSDLELETRRAIANFAMNN